MGSLFDGIGGFPLAAQRCGIRPMWASEIEPFPVDVTKLRLPGMIHVGDITKLNGADLPPVDVITGGSPCQDLSVAGASAGLAGSRSGLFMEQTRIVKEMRHADLQRGRSDVLVRPRFMVWENVPGAFSSMCWYSFHTLGSPHLMKNWKPSCPGHPISSKTIKFQIPMHTQSAISTNERQASNTRPAVLGATGRLLSAYMSIFLCLLDYERRLLATVWWIVATNLAFRRKVSPTEASELTHYLFFTIFRRNLYSN